MVIAPAGFGKTTLVSSWVESLAKTRTPPIPAAWITLDEFDSDLIVFLRYWLAAINTIFPDSCHEAGVLLRAAKPVSLPSLVIALTNDIEQLPGPFVLVLDDYFTIQSAEVHEFLGGLLRHCPANLHLVLITRTNPPLPLSKLRGRYQLAEIRARDLRLMFERIPGFIVEEALHDIAALANA